jgi:exopolysaccharide biosynthesis polyprenyl glycosylphosphotransferase
LVSKHAAIRRLLIGLDAATLLASMAIAYLLQPLLRTVLSGLKSPSPLSSFVIVGYLTLPLWMALSSVLGLHRIFERVASFAEVIVGLVKLHVLGVMGLAVVDFVTQLHVNRSIVALFVVTSFTSMATVRWLLSRWVAWQRASGRDRERVLLVGDPGPELSEFLRRAHEAPLPPTVVGYLAASPGAENAAAPDDALPPRLGDVGGLREVLHDQAIDQVLFFPPLADPGGSAAAVAACEELGVIASFAVGRVSALRSPPRVLSVYETPVVAYVVSPKPPLLLAIKQVFDVLAAALLLVVLAPALVVITVAVWIGLGRPVLFSQERVGRNGRRFRMYKFRSMIAGAEALQSDLAHLNESQGPTFKAARDPRITRLGHFLRRTSIDELPQLFNVLEGTMSLVGPRPLPLPEQQRIFGADRRRLSMKPGITGLWQVSGRSDVGFVEWMRLDREYVDRWSLELDVVILLKTIPAVLLRRGAR